jgi:hypothetical protein
MGSLYSITTNREALRELARAIGEWQDKDLGNFEPLPAVFPNRMAPVVRLLPNGDRPHMHFWQNALKRLK